MSSSSLLSAELQQAKLVLLGDMGAGKSSLVLRFVKGQFHDYQESTIGAAFLTKSMPDHGVKFEIWDTAGQERYHSLAPMYYRGAAAAVVVYDVTSRDSFARAQAWVRELQRQASPGLVIALAGNKADLANSAAAAPAAPDGPDAGSDAPGAAASSPSSPPARAVATADAAAYAAESGLHFWETSAKDGTNVAELFADVASRLPTRASAAAAAAAGAGGGAGGSGGGGGITLTQAPPQRNAKAACC